MARPLRIEFDGVLYHLTSRGNERKAIFKDDTDRRLFLSTLAEVVRRFHWLCHAYCLMDALPGFDGQLISRDFDSLVLHGRLIMQ